MTIAQIMELVDHISETWRDSAPAEQHTDLADLDAALAELDEIEIDSQTASEAVEELRGRVEILMDEIDIALGVEPAPMDSPDEADDDEAVELGSQEEDEPLVRVDDPKASDLMTAVQSHLAAGSAAVLREDLEAIDALDHDASSALRQGSTGCAPGSSIG